MTDENSTQSSPFNVAWWIAAAFILIVIVATAVVLATRNESPQAGPSSSPTTSADASPTPGETSSSSPGGNTEGVCNLPVADQDIPVDAPEATWEPHGYILVPSSDVYGPVPGKDPLWPCFAHSPSGALFAAMHLYVGLTDRGYEEFARSAAVEGPALETWLAEQDPELVRQEPGATIQYAGFRFQQVEPDAVVVDVAGQQGPVTGYVRLSLVWDATTDNWKADLAASNLNPTSVETLATFTLWSAA